MTGRVTTRDDGLPLPGATVSIAALKLNATTDSDGRYRLEIPAALAKGQAVEISVTFAGLQPKSLQASWHPARSPTTSRSGSPSPRRSRWARAPRGRSREGGAGGRPDARQIESTGASETRQIIQALAPSFNFPRPTIADGADTVRPATLRGLGPDQVLVLINGKRRHQTALITSPARIGRGSTGVDLNAIPVSAIERIEILRDGAAAQYGSDAIAGVINIVLKSGAQPVDAVRQGGRQPGQLHRPDGRASATTRTAS